MGSRDAGMPAWPAARGAAGLKSVLFARGRPAERPGDTGSEFWITVKLTRSPIAQHKRPAAPAQRGGDFGQRHRHHAEAALVGIIADAEIEMPHAVGMQRRHGAFDD